MSPSRSRKDAHARVFASPGASSRRSTTSRRSRRTSRRVGLVIRFRWMLVTRARRVLGGRRRDLHASSRASRTTRSSPTCAIPAVALVFVLAYNTYYQLTYRLLGNIAILNHAQLLFDSLVITVLVHYSGGVYSWFYPMYALIVLEAAFIFPRPRDTWIVAARRRDCSYGAVLLGASTSASLPHVPMPFVTGGLRARRARTSPCASCGGSTVLSAARRSSSLQMMQRVHEREAAARRPASTTDEATGPAQPHVLPPQARHRAPARALLRAVAVACCCSTSTTSAAFNQRFGLEGGQPDAARARRALLEHETCECPDSRASPAQHREPLRRRGVRGHPARSRRACRADEASDDAAAAARAAARGVGALRVDDMGVTVSVGLACYPRDGAHRGRSARCGRPGAVRGRCSPAATASARSDEPQPARRRCSVRALAGARDVALAAVARRRRRSSASPLLVLQAPVRHPRRSSRATTTRHGRAAPARSPSTRPRRCARYTTDPAAPPLPAEVGGRPAFDESAASPPARRARRPRGRAGADARLGGARWPRCSRSRCPARGARAIALVAGAPARSARSRSPSLAAAWAAADFDALLRGVPRAVLLRRDVDVPVRHAAHRAVPGAAVGRARGAVGRRRAPRGGARARSPPGRCCAGSVVMWREDV